MNIIEAEISNEQIRFEGIEIKAPNHLSKLTDSGLKIGLRSSDIELSENGHEFESRYNDINNGIGCPHCSGKARKTVADYHNLAKKRGFRWLGPKVPNTKSINFVIYRPKRKACIHKQCICLCRAKDISKYLTLPFLV